MSDKSKIEWCDATWNVVTGCSKVSAACKNCYAERQWPRLAANQKTAYYGRKFTDVQCHPEKLTEPLRWKKPRRIFVPSMGDLFHPDVPFEFIDKVFAVMALAHWHTFIVLTKRPERMREYCESSWQSRIIPYLRKYGRVPEGRGVSLETTGGCLRHVQLGVSVEDQSTADERIPVLLETPAAVRIVSAEPLLGPVDLRKAYPSDYMYCTGCGFGGIPDFICCACHDQDSEFSDWPDGNTCNNGHSNAGSIEKCPNCGNIDNYVFDYISDDVFLPLHGIHQVIAGGESGPKARPTHPEWFRSLRDQCATFGVPFVMKQWGEWAPRSDCYHTLTNGYAAADIDPGAKKWPCIRLTERGLNGHDLANTDGGCDAYVQKVGKKRAGRLLDGVLHDEYPEARS